METAAPARERVADRIDTILRETGITKTELERWAGLAQGHLSKICDGRVGRASQTVGVTTVEAISRALHLSPDVLLQWAPLPAGWRENILDLQALRRKSEILGENNCTAVQT